jgi:hypothetical protein
MLILAPALIAAESPVQLVPGQNEYHAVLELGPVVIEGHRVNEMRLDIHLGAEYAAVNGGFHAADGYYLLVSGTCYVESLEAGKIHCDLRVGNLHIIADVDRQLAGAARICSITTGTCFGSVGVALKSFR